jgi:transposase-like protein
MTKKWKTKFGFITGFDTQKRKKYSDKVRLEIARLSKLGLSTRKIAAELNIPSGSIHYILREFNLIFPSATKPNSNYLTRAEAKYLYDITDSQFDYARAFHKAYTVKFNNVVFLHVDYIYNYIEDKKGYRDRYERVRHTEKDT